MCVTAALSGIMAVALLGLHPVEATRGK